MADSLWSLFDDEDAVPAGAAEPVAVAGRGQGERGRRLPLPVGVAAFDHPFFRDSNLWPIEGSPTMNLSTIQDSVAADIRQHLTVEVLKHIRDSADCPAASDLLHGMHQAVLDQEEAKARDCARAFVNLAAARLNSGRGDALEAWSMGLLFACTCVALGNMVAIQHSELLKAEDKAALCEEALWCTDTAIINSCRMQDGSSRWEFPYLKSVVGCLVQLAERQLSPAGGALVNQEREGKSAAAGPQGAMTIPGTLPTGAEPSIPMANQLQTRHCTDLPVVDFLNEYLAAHRPVVIKGYLKHCQWQALQSWGSLSSWSARHGHRLVPVELQQPGGHCGALRTMKLKNFISDFLVPSVRSHEVMGDTHGYGPFLRNSHKGEGRGQGKEPSIASDEARIAYVSQHALFHQLRDTQHEFTVPAYARGGGRLAMVNVWMGTRGTVTHLHTDEHDNLLAQVAGFKLVRLCSTSHRDQLYATQHPRATPENPLNWFSPVDAEQPDLEQHPLAAGVKWQDTILGPGDMLFIPKGYWHYVRALTTSVSVNFWF